MTQAPVHSSECMPQLGLHRNRPACVEKWWTPVVSLEYQTHSAHNIAATACALGVGIGCGLTLALSNGWSDLGVFGMYVAFLALYHMLEYMCVALYNPRRVDLESFMFDPDGECLYIIAMGVSTVEYVIGHWLYGSGWRTSGTLIFVGLTAALAGQAVRTLAMVTTKTSFNHIIAERREGDHKLITHGIYCYERHPSYVGFYLWAVGLQVMLRNPITGILFAGGLGYFFSKRVKFEEYTLVSLFGAEYDEYTKRTGTLIPVFGERKRPVNYMAPPPATGGRKSPIRIDGNKS